MSQSLDLFDFESRTLAAARAVYEDASVEMSRQHAALGELIAAYEKLLRETRRLIRRSDREELEMNQLNQRLHDLAQELEYRATHDSLTGVLNRAAIIDYASRLLTQDDLALIVLDIDHFKRVNDTYGHPAGDRVICAVVDQLKALVPPASHIGRVGGEEFTVLLPGFSITAAADVAEAMRHAIDGSDEDRSSATRVTASFGVSWLPRGKDFGSAYGCADDALYAAKRDGRNRVVRADQMAGGTDCPTSTC